MKKIILNWNKFLVFGFVGVFTAQGVWAKGETLETVQIVKPNMTSAELSNLKGRLKTVEAKACGSESYGSKLVKNGKIILSGAADSLPFVPLAWTGIQQLRGQQEKIEEKKKQAGGAGTLYATQAVGGVVMTVPMLAATVLEAALAYFATHDTVTSQGYVYNSNTGRSEYATFTTYVPNGKTYESVGAIGKAAEWVRAAYANTRTVEASIERDRVLRAEVCLQAQENQREVDYQLRELQYSSQSYQGGQISQSTNRRASGVTQ